MGGWNRRQFVSGVVAWRVVVGVWTGFLAGVLAAIAGYVSAQEPAPAQKPAWYEGFEGHDTSWTFVGGNARYQVEHHGRMRGEAHTGEGSEQIRISGSGGSEVLIAHDLGQPRIIDELLPTVWLKADRPGLQVFVQVVLPRTVDPRTQRPVTTLLPGSTYTTAGRWQQLRVEDIPRALNRQTRVLRTQLGPGVDPREAYVERLLVNVYGGPGTTNVWLDDLDVAGFVGPPDGKLAPAVPLPQGGPNAAAPASSGTTQDRAAGGGSESSANPVPPAARVRTVDSMLMVDDRPLLPLAIQYQGEPMPLLRQLGFNAVWFWKTPSRELLEEAARAGLWVVCPPPQPPQPESIGGIEPPVQELGPMWDRVLAWDLGSGLGESQVAAVQRWEKQVRAADRRQSGRPLICQADAQQRTYSRSVDFLVHGRQPLGTTLELSDYAAWLRERPRLAQSGTPFWTTVQTQPATSLTQQWRAFGLAEPPAAFPVEQVQLLALTSLAAGSRGLLFLSDAPLSDRVPASQTRALAMELLNLRLGLVEPWAAAGSVQSTIAGSEIGAVSSPEAVPSPEAAASPGAVRSRGAARSRGAIASPGPAATPGVVATLLEREHARLLMPLWLPAHAQCAAGAFGGAGGVRFLVPGVSETNHAYEIGAGGLHTLRTRRETGGQAILLDEFSSASLVLVAHQPEVVERFRQRLEQIGPRMIELERDLARRRLEETAAIVGQLPGRIPAAQTGSRLDAAKRHLAQADTLAMARDFVQASQCVDRAMRPLRRLERAQWEAAVASVRSPVASPATGALAAIPLHWQFLERLRGATVLANLVPSGDFEDFDSMMQSGWQRFQHETPGLDAAAELVPRAAHGGRAGLCLSLRRIAKTPAAKPARGAAAATPPPIESPPLWMTTPPVRVEAGAVVCIQGWVRVDEQIDGSVDGLLIVDSFGGEALAERVRKTAGWQPFVMYRIAPHEGQLTVTFAMTGVGEAHIDDVAVHPLAFGAPAR